MTDCEVPLKSSINQYVLMHSIINRNMSDNFMDIIEDYVPERNEKEDNQEYELSGSKNASDYCTASSCIDDQTKMEHLKKKSQFQIVKSRSMPSITDFGVFGWKVYDYIENALGLKENGIYEPEFVEGRDCVECTWNSSSGGLLKGLDGILRGFRVCGLCSKTFCFDHCSFKRRLMSSNEKELNQRNTESVDQHLWMNVCKKCFEKGQTQSLGQTKDHTSAFVKLRAKKNNVLEQRQDKILRNLENLSKKLPQQVDAFSIWNLSNALPSAQELFQVSDSARKSCAICETQFSFWIKYQTCQLCTNLCCTSCCSFSVPLAKSPINPNAPKDRPGEIMVCKQCFHLINLKKKRIKHSQMTNSEAPKQMMKQYDYIVALKKEIEEQLADYLAKTEMIESSILDQFELVPKTKRDSSVSVNLSEPLRSGSQKQLEKMTPLFLEYQKSINKFLETPAQNKREKMLLCNLKTAFQDAESYVLLSQKIQITQ